MNECWYDQNMTVSTICSQLMIVWYCIHFIGHSEGFNLKLIIVRTIFWTVERFCCCCCCYCLFVCFVFVCLIVFVFVEVVVFAQLDMLMHTHKHKINCMKVAIRKGLSVCVYKINYTTGSGDSSVVRASDSWSKFSSPGSTFCGDSYFDIRSTPVLR